MAEDDTAKKAGDSAGQKPRSKKPPMVALKLGPLPVECLERVLGLELESGDVMLSINAQKHAAKRHAEEYAACLPHVAAVVTSPLYVGDDHRNPGKIELVSRVPSLGEGLGLLVVVKIEADENGLYHVVSFYPVSEKKIANRRQKGALHSAQ